MTDEIPANQGTPSRGTVVRRITRQRGRDHLQTDDRVAEETPIALVYNDTPFAVMMATPADLGDFVYGFSLSEGLVASPAQIKRVEISELLEGIQIHVLTEADCLAANLDAHQRRLLPGRGSCGICGTRDLEEAVRPPQQVEHVPAFNPMALERALAQAPQHQPMNALTGAVHAAFWVDLDGTIVLSREDVGRHNALDKLIGAMRDQDIAPETGMLLLTSRASYEMVTKAARAGIGLVAAISAPTALAVDLARSAGISLVGFARRGSYNVYTPSVHADSAMPTHD